MKDIWMVSVGIDAKPAKKGANEVVKEFDRVAESATKADTALKQSAKSRSTELKEMLADTNKSIAALEKLSKQQGAASTLAAEELSKLTRGSEEWYVAYKKLSDANNAAQQSHLKLYAAIGKSEALTEAAQEAEKAAAAMKELSAANTQTEAGFLSVASAQERGANALANVAAEVDGTATAIKDLSETTTESTKELEEGFNGAAEAIIVLDEATAGSTKKIEEAVSGTTDAVRELDEATSDSADTIKKEVSDATDVIEDLGTETEKSAKQAEGGFDRVKESLKNLSLQLGAIALVIGTFTAAARSAVGFQQAMAEVASVATDAHAPMEEISVVVRDMAEEFGVMPVEQAKAMYQVMRSGARDAASAQKELYAANKLSRIALTDLTSAVDAISTIMRSYNLSADEAEGVTDALFVAFKGGDITVQQLASSLGDVATQANALGVSYEDLLITVRAMTSAGADSEETMSGISAVIDALNSPTRELRDKIHLLGDSWRDASGEGNDFASLLMTLVEETGGSAAELEKLLGSATAAEAVLKATADGGYLLSKSMQEMADKAKHADKANEELKNTIQTLENEIRNRLTSAFQEFGTKGLGVWTKALQFVNEHLDTMIAGVKVLGIVVAGVAAGQLATLATALGTLGMMLIGTAGATGALTTAFAALKGVALTLFGGPTGLIVGAVVTVGLLAKAFMGSKQSTNDWGAALVDAAGDADTLARSMDTLIEKFKEMEPVRQRLHLSKGASRIDEIKAELAEVDKLVARATSERNMDVKRDGTKGAAWEHHNAELEKYLTQKYALRDQLEVMQELWAKEAASVHEANAAYAASEGHRLGLQDSMISYKATLAAVVAEQTEQARLMGEMDETAIASFKAIMDSVDPVNAVYDKYNEKIKEVASGYRDLTDSQKAEIGVRLTMQETIVRLAKERDKELAQVYATLKAVDDVTKARKAYNDLLKGFEAIANPAIKHEMQLAAALDQVAERAKAAGVGFDEYSKAQEKVEKQIKDSWMKNAVRNIEMLRAGTDRLAQAEVERVQGLEALKEADIYVQLGMIEGTEALKLQEEWLRLSTEALEAYIAKKKEQIEVEEYFKTEAGQQAKQYAVVWEEALKNIDKAFVDLWKGAFEGFDSMIESMKNGFKDLLANMAHQALTKPIMVAITTAMTPTKTLASGQVINALTGEAVPEGSSMGSGIGGAFSGAVSAFKGAVADLSFAGASMFEGAKTFLSQGTGSLQMGGWSGVGGAVAGAGMGALSGSLANSVFGARGKNNTAWSSVGGAIGSIWGPIGSLIGGAIGSLVSNILGGAKALESAVIKLEGGFDGVNGVLETVTSKQKSFFRGRRFYTNTEDLDLENVGEIFAQMKGGLQGIAEALGIEFGNFFETFNVSKEINIKGLSQEAAMEKMETEIKNIFVRAMSGLISAAEGMSERFEATIKQFKGDTDEFMAAFEMLALIDINSLTKPSERYQEILAEQNRTLTASYRMVLDEYNNVLEAYDGSLDSLAAVTEATLVLSEIQLQLVAAFYEVGQAATAMFTDTADQIREALMTPEELYNLRDNQIDSLVEQLSRATDPAEIARLTEDINSKTLEAWGLLDEGQQVQLQSDFLKFLDEVSTLTGDVVGSGIAGIDSDAEAADTALSNALINAAQTQQDAANRFSDGVDRWIDALEQLPTWKQDYFYDRGREKELAL